MKRVFFNFCKILGFAVLAYVAIFLSLGAVVFIIEFFKELLFDKDGALPNLSFTM